MFRANVGEMKVLIMPHNGQYIKKSKKENPTCKFVAFEIKLMKILRPNQTKKAAKTGNDIQNIEEKGIKIKCIRGLNFK